jgi:hypothetical protein
MYGMEEKYLQFKDAVKKMEKRKENGRKKNGINRVKSLQGDSLDIIPGYDFFGNHCQPYLHELLKGWEMR